MNALEYDGSRPCLPPQAMMELARRIALKRREAFLRTGKLVWKSKTEEWQTKAAAGLSPCAETGLLNAIRRLEEGK